MLYLSSVTNIICVVCFVLGLLGAFSLLLSATHQLLWYIFSSVLCALWRQIFTVLELKQTNKSHASYSSTVPSSVMLCSWAMPASSLRNSANRTMANTRLLACAGMGGQGGRTLKGGRGRAFFTEPFGRDGSRITSPPCDWRHSKRDEEM